MEVMSPITEKIFDYVHNLLSYKTCELDPTEIMHPYRNEFIVSTSDSQMMPLTEIIFKIDNHNSIQDSIMNQTVSK